MFWFKMNTRYDMAFHSIFLAFLLSFLLSDTTGEMPAPPKARNIILMIGDGMGISQVSAGMYANGNKTNLEKFSVTGLQKATASDRLITDSASGGTALACGVKTYVGAIGVNTDTMPVISILEEAEARGMATGMVTTSSITHATPAVFIAHVKLRNQFEDIAASFLKTEIDLFIGGGKKYFNRRITDNRNLIHELEKKGYFVSDYRQQPLDEIVPLAQKNFAYFTADAEPPPASKGRDYLPRASNMATYFLDRHSGKDGFFLMIEGAQIDWAGHENDNDYLVSEMIDFDEAIGRALKFAERDGQTLVIVTADHETGGYAINPGSRMDSLITAFTTDKHTAALIPVFAYGPGAEYFHGFYDNTAIYTKMRQALGWEER